MLDSILLLASGIIGSGIFLTAKRLPETHVPYCYFSLYGPSVGVIAMLACFAFAEMGAMFPEAGGQYIYLREAYGGLSLRLDDLYRKRLRNHRSPSGAGFAP